MVKIHDIKFYKPESKAIYCMTLQREENKLALSRSDSNIEIWNLQNLPYIEKIIHNPLNYNVEEIIWSKSRLFSCTLQGFLYEYNLLNLGIKQSESLTGEAAYSLDVNKNNSNLVVGTENGYLNVFDITNEGIKFLRFLDKQEGRILCIKYDHTGNFIVSGGIDAIRIYDANSGHALHKMTTGRSAVNKSTIVWCLEVTSDFVIISGDSRGKLTFWDGKIGSQIDNYQSHKADILALTISEDENTLFCAGIDSTLTSYVKVNVKDQNMKWVKSIQRRVHDHDVRALVLFNNKLYSAGIDGYLACSFHPPKTIIKYPPFLQNNCVLVNKNTRLLILQYHTFIEIWSLGTTVENHTNTRTFQLKHSSKKLLHLERLLKNGSNELYQEPIVCSSMSSDGKWIAYSTPSVVKLYKFAYENLETPQLKPIKTLPWQCKVSVRIIFTPDNQELILALCSGNIIVLDLNDISIKQEIETHSNKAITKLPVLDDVFLHLLISTDGNYLVAADVNSNIGVWSKNPDAWLYFCKLPKYTCAATALAIQPTTNNLWIAYADHKVTEYQLQERKLTSFSKAVDVAQMNTYANKYFSIRNITFDLKDSNIVMLHDDTNIVVIKKNKISSNAQIKVQKTSSEVGKLENKERRNSFSSYKRYRHLLYLEALSEDELVVVEVNPLKLIEKLPPCLKQNNFGTK